MNTKLLWGIIVVLLITNMATLIVWNQARTSSTDTRDNMMNDNAPVAEIDSEAISYQEWMTSLRANQGRKHLKNMMNHEVVQQLSDKRDITISDKVIDREIALLTTMQGPMTENETNEKEKEWRRDIIHRYQLEALLTADTDTDIPEEEVRTYYNNYEDQYDFQASTQLSHITVPDSEAADKIIEELNNGASFQLLAQEYSTDSDSRADGGYMGFFVNSSHFLPEGYLDRVSEMEERSYSESFRSGGSVVIVYLHRKLPSITFDFEEIKPYVRREMTMDRLDKSLSAESLWGELDIEWLYEE